MGTNMIGAKWTFTWLFVSVVVLSCSGLLLQVAASENQLYLPSLQCYDAYTRPQVRLHMQIFCQWPPAYSLCYTLTFTSSPPRLHGLLCGMLDNKRYYLNARDTKSHITLWSEPICTKPHTQTNSTAFIWVIYISGWPAMLIACNHHN